MADSHGLDIGKLTGEAEAGQGCSIRSALEGLSFQDSVKALYEIAQQNKADHAANAMIPELAIYAGDLSVNNNPAAGPTVELYVPSSIFLSQDDTLVSDTLSIRNSKSQFAGQRTLQCKDLGRESH